MAEETILVIGASGSGKTWFASTAPGRDGKKLMLDLECKAKHLPEERRKGWTIEEYPDSPILEALDMHARDEHVSSTTRPMAYRKLVRRVNKLYAEEWDVVVLDSWSKLCDIANRQMHANASRLGLPITQPEYGVLNAKWLEVLPALVGIPCRLFLMTAHEELGKDELTGKMFYTPYSYGQAIRPIMPTYFGNVFRTVIGSPDDEGAPRYLVLTRSRGLFTLGKTIHPGLPPVLPNDMRMEAWKGGEKT